VKMEYPPAWQIFDMELFSSALPRAAGELTGELLVQARPNGRMLDHFRVTLGGSRILDISFPLANILALPGAAGWRLKMQTWPRDIALRRNMMSSEWVSLDSIIASKDGVIYNAEDVVVPHADVLEKIQEAEVSAAVRYAVVIGGDQGLQLMMQGMPASAESLMGKPAFRG
jgi:hypothetical protein